MIEQTLQTPNARVLIVDDDADVLAMLDSALKDFGCDVVKALSASECMALTEAAPPDLILLDIVMPEIDGYQACKLLKSNSRFKDIPVIFLSGLNSTDVKVKAFQAGGVDYITKPFQIPELQARVGTHLNLCALRYKQEFQNMVEEKVRTFWKRNMRLSSPLQNWRNIGIVTQARIWSGSGFIVVCLPSSSIVTRHMHLNSRTNSFNAFSLLLRFMTSARSPYRTRFFSNRAN